MVMVRDNKSWSAVEVCCLTADLDVEGDRAAGQVGPRYLQAQLPDTAKLDLDRKLQDRETVGPQFEVDEENVTVESSAADIVQVQVLHNLAQVRVEDVGEECVEHFLSSEEASTL